MKTILVATDFSECSLNALHYAAIIAEKAKAHISLLHVCKPFAKSLYYPDTKAQEKKESEKKLKDLASKYEKKLKGRINTIVREGKVYKEIVSQAKYIDAYIIVVGAHGISGFEEYFMGSNAYKVVNTAPCPTLTITDDFKAAKIERIMLPIDNSIESRQKTMFTAEIAELLGAKINVLGVFNSKDATIKNRIKQYCNQVVNYLGKKNIKNTLEFSEETNIPDAALSYAEVIKPQIISIMSEADPFSLNMILGSNAQKMVHQSKYPVLCMHPKKEYNYPVDFSGTV
jgi:nucleotide-binding universal stress UspA family protein